MNELDDNIKNEANEAALLNVIMYMDIQDVSAKNGSKVSDIIDSLGAIYDSPDGYNEYLKKHKDGSLDDYKDRQRQYQLLASASNSNSHFANSKIGDQSRLMNNPSYKEGGLGAATFTDTDGNVKVAYRGTGSGEWIDNGRAISGTVGIGSAQQKEAVDYFNRVVESNHYDVTKPNIEITGHSKGGNKAQFVTINSQYRDLIYRCYNFDGQGMSPEAIEEFKKTYGEDAYIEATNKMYGFYNENDFVNPLGIYAVPESHRYYFESTAVKHGIADDIKYHYWDSYLNDDGTFSKQTGQGPISKLVEDFSQQASNLPPNIRVKVTDLFMKIMQGNNKTVNGETVSMKDCIIGGVISLPLLLADLAFTPEGWATVDILGGDLILTAKEKYGPLAELGSAAVLAAICPPLFADDLGRVLIKDFKAIAGIVIEDFKKIGNYIIGKIEQFGNWLSGVADKVGDALRKFAEGAKKAWGGVKNFVTGLYNGIVDTGKAVGNAIDNFKKKATDTVSNFFKGVASGAKKFFGMIGKSISNTWNSAVDKATKTADRIVSATKSEIKKEYEKFKDGANYLVTYTKKTLGSLGEKGKAVLKAFGKKVARGAAAFMSTKLSVDLLRLSDLQNKMRSLERNLDERVHRILNEANRVTSDVERSYSEYYVRQQVSSVSRTCDQVRENGKRVCDALERKANSLRYAMDHYRQIEGLLCNEIKA